MAIADLDTFKLKLITPYQYVVNSARGGPTIGGSTGATYGTWDMWTNFTIPGNNAVPANTTTAGAMGQTNAASGSLTVIGMEMRWIVGGVVLLCDRLSHSSGLVANVATTQTTNLPTAALTRYTSGVGVWAGLTCVGATGNTVVAVTASYTNSAGTSGRTSQARPMGFAFGSLSQQFLELPVQAGDKGVRSVESVTLSATTGSAGAVHCVLYKPLAMFVVAEPNDSADQRLNLIDGGLSGGFPVIQSDAALFFLQLPGPIGTVSGNGQNPALQSVLQTATM